MSGDKEISVKKKQPIPSVVHLGAMLRAESRGSYRSLRRQIEWYGHRFGDGCEPSVAGAYAELLERSKAGFEYERVHGEGSLLKLDDPRNRSPT